MSSQLWRRTRQLGVATLALLIVLLTAGAIFQWLGVRAEAGRYPPPGSPRAMSTSVLVDDLERLLGRAAIPPPYVLVSSSIGGLATELFARRHADRVAGLVFLEAANSDMLDRSTRPWLSANVGYREATSQRAPALDVDADHLERLLRARQTSKASCDGAADAFDLEEVQQIVPRV